MTRLTPAQLRPNHIVKCFPYLQVLDLAACTESVRPSKLRPLRQLEQLTWLSLGARTRSVAAAVTERCVVEAAGFTGLQHLGLSNCVHLGDRALMAIGSMTNLTSVDLSGCVAVSDVGLVLLSHLPRLATLELAWCLKITTAGLKALGGAHHCLTSLNVSGCQLVSEAGIAALGCLTGLSSLTATSLGAAQPCITDAALQRLSGLTSLRSLAIGGIASGSSRLTDAGLAAVPVHHPLLQKFELQAADGVTDAGLIAVAEGCASTLTSFRVRGCARVTSALIKHVAQLPSLQELDVLNNHAMILDLRHIVQLAKPLPQKPTLQRAPDELHTAWGVTTSAAALTTQNQGSYTFQRNSWSSGTTTTTTTKAENSCDALPTGDRPCGPRLPLQSLSLGSVVATSAGSCLDDSCLASLAPLGRSLTRLSLTAFTTSLASQEAAQGLAALPHLTSLELQGAAALTDTGLAVLCHSPCAPQLCHLALQHTSAGLVTEHGLQLLAATCTSLTTLNLSYCGSAVSDAVLLQLASSVPRLKELQCSLAGGVTDAGLVALLRCPQLDLLDLSYCQGITGRVGQPGTMPTAPGGRQSTERQGGAGVAAMPVVGPGGASSSSSNASSGSTLSAKVSLGAVPPAAPALANPGLGWLCLGWWCEEGLHRAAAGATTQPASSGGQCSAGASVAWGGAAGSSMANATSTAPAPCHHSLGQGPPPSVLDPPPHIHGSANPVAHNRDACPTPASWHLPPPHTLPCPHPSQPACAPSLAPSPIPSRSKLQHLALSCCGLLSDPGVEQLAACHPQLTHLDLAQCAALTDSGLASLVPLTRLTSLDLSHCSRLSDAACACLAQLPLLATLKLNGCIRVGDAGLALLCGTGRAGLLTLHLDRCIKITDAGLQQLAQVTSLTSLRLARCPELTDVGVAALSRLVRLSTLSLAHCNITEVGLLALSPLTALASMEF
ncbi:hypothetical protein V8C86DRAFT_2747442 [Haematococcus lacustris]